MLPMTVVIGGGEATAAIRLQERGIDTWGAWGAGGRRENSWDSVVMLLHSLPLSLVNAGFFFSVVGLNVFGLYVTQTLGSVFRAVLLTTRTATVPPPRPRTAPCPPAPPCPTSKLCGRAHVCVWDLCVCVCVRECLCVCARALARLWASV